MELMLSTIEEKIITGLVSGSRKAVASDLGIPLNAVVELMRKKGVKEYLAELREAQREMLMNRAIQVVSATLEDKIDIINEDEEKRLGTATRKDPVDIAKTLSEMLKSSTPLETEAANPMAKIYQQINILNSEK
jgi:hypothetical protein